MENWTGQDTESSKKWVLLVMMENEEQYVFSHERGGNMEKDGKIVFSWNGQEKGELKIAINQDFICKRIWLYGDNYKLCVITI